MRDDGRAQSIQIGAVLLFGILVLLLGLTQAFIVPDENKQVEFNHNQRVQDDMTDLRSNLLRSVAAGSPRSSTVRLGTSYPSRTLFVNPAPPGGTLRTEDGGEIVVDDAVAVDGEAADYLDGSRRSFRTQELVYDPSYNVYRRAPTTRLEASVLYNRFPKSGSTVNLTGQTLVSGKDITLTAIRGSLSASKSTAAGVDPRVVSGPSKRLSIEGDDGPVTISVRTSLSESTWRDLLDGELDPSGTNGDRYVRSFSCANPDPCGTLTLELERGTEYTLRMGEVGVGSQIPEEGPEYVVVESGDDASVDEGRSRSVTLEVRDRFNNPVSGATVTVDSPQTGYLTTTQGTVTLDGAVEATTNENGRVTFTYRAPLNVRTTEAIAFDANVAGVGGDAGTAAVNIEVQDTPEAVSNTDWGRPLIDAVEPTPGVGDQEFVRVYSPSTAARSGWTLEDDDDSVSLGTLTGLQGEVYFAEDPATFAANHPVAPSRVFGLDPVSLDSSDHLRIVDPQGRTRDAFAYGGATTGHGWSYTFTGGQTDQVALRVTEDSAYADGNVSTDFDQIDESDFFDTGAPSVLALGASANHVSGVGSPPGPGSDRVTFTYSVEDPQGINGISFEVETWDGQTVQRTQNSDPDGSIVLSFSAVSMDESVEDIDVTVVATDAAGNRRTCEGTIVASGQTVTDEGDGLCP